MKNQQNITSWMTIKLYNHWRQQALHDILKKQLNGITLIREDGLSLTKTLHSPKFP